VLRDHLISHLLAAISPEVAEQERLDPTGQPA
jgi:hypothetical protein